MTTRGSTSSRGPPPWGGYPEAIPGSPSGGWGREGREGPPFPSPGPWVLVLRGLYPPPGCGRVPPPDEEARVEGAPAAEERDRHLPAVVRAGVGIRICEVGTPDVVIGGRLPGWLVDLDDTHVRM